MMIDEGYMAFIWAFYWYSLGCRDVSHVDTLVNAVDAAAVYSRILQA
jgi:hypothetical protein